MSLFRPVHCCMYQHGSGELYCCSNGSLNDAVLMMGSDTAECQSLITTFKFFSKDVGNEDTIVAMVLFDVNVALASFMLPNLFGFDSVMGTEGDLVPMKDIGAGVVNANCAATIFFMILLSATRVWETAFDAGLVVIQADDVTGLYVVSLESHVFVWQWF